MPDSYHPNPHLLELFAPSEQQGYTAVFAVLDSMSREYHGSRGMPDMSLDDHLVHLRLDAESVDFVRQHLRLISISGGQLIDRGLGRDLLLTLDVIDIHGNERRDRCFSFAAEIAWSGGELVCLIPWLLYVDLNQPGRACWS